VKECAFQLLMLHAGDLEAEDWFRENDQHCVEMMSATVHIGLHVPLMEETFAKMAKEYMQRHEPNGLWSLQSLLVRQGCVIDAEDTEKDTVRVFCSLMRDRVSAIKEQTQIAYQAHLDVGMVAEDVELPSIEVFLPEEARAELITPTDSPLSFMQRFVNESARRKCLDGLEGDEKQAVVLYNREIGKIQAKAFRFVINLFENATARFKANVTGSLPTNVLAGLLNALNAPRENWDEYAQWRENREEWDALKADIERFLTYPHRSEQRMQMELFYEHGLIPRLLALFPKGKSAGLAQPGRWLGPPVYDDQTSEPDRVFTQIEYWTYPQEKSNVPWRT
ncbi:MAG: hypothetical protein AAGJ35_00720, partial [Myxococcota bacterium]